MPYGIPEEAWRKLPPDDKAAVIAGGKGRSAAATAGSTPTAPAPMPNLVYGIPADIWRRLPADDQAAVRAESQGATPPAIGGYAPVTATSAPPPNLSGPGSSRTNATGDYPAARSVMNPTKVRMGQQTFPVGWTLATREAQIGRTRRLAAYPTPGTEPIPSYWETAKGLTNFFQDPSDPITGKLEAKGIPKELVKAYLEREYEQWVKDHWHAPVQPTYAQTAEFLKLWEANKNPEAALLRRGYAIEKDLAHARGARREKLLSALSSLSLVLTYKTFGNVYGPDYLPKGGALR